jgi:alkanesulfonate monooxygenase
VSVAGTADKYTISADFAAALGAALGGTDHEGPVFRLPPATGTPRVSGDRLPTLFAPASTNPDFAGLLPALGRCLVMAKPRETLATEVEKLTKLGLTGQVAMLVGIVARDSDDAAWQVAAERHGGDRRDALLRAAFRHAATSSQHQATFSLADEATVHDECLWYGAGRVGIDCPKLVGAYETVASALHRYRDLGVECLVVDLPDTAEEYRHVERTLAGWAA